MKAQISRFLYFTSFKQKLNFQIFTFDRMENWFPREKSINRGNQIVLVLM